MNFEKARAIAASASDNLRELAIEAGEDPKTFWQGADLAGVDVRDQDLRGIDLINCRFDGIRANAKTQVDRQFASPLFQAARLTAFFELDAMFKSGKGDPVDIGRLTVEASGIHFGLAPFKAGSQNHDGMYLIRQGLLQPTSVFPTEADEVLFSPDWVTTEMWEEVVNAWLDANGTNPRIRTSLQRLIDGDKPTGYQRWEMSSELADRLFTTLAALPVS